METRLRWHVAALIGVLGVGAALAAGHLVAALVGSSASPYLAVANSAVDLSPPWLVEFGKQFGPEWDKLLLFIGIAVALVGFAVLAGLLSRRSPLPGTVLAVVLGLIGVAAVLYRPDVGQLAVLAPIASIVAGVVVLRWLHALAMTAGPSTTVTGKAPGKTTGKGPDEPTDGFPGEPVPAGAEPGGTARDSGVGRRRFLVTSGGVAAGVGVAAVGGQYLGGRADIQGSRQAVGVVTAARPAPPIPAGADFAKAGTPSFITPNKDFYRIDTALTVPRVRAEDWRLRVHGLVDNELELTFDDIRGRTQIEKTITMTCVSNEIGGGLISTANFVGVSMRELLMEAGVRPEAGQVFATSVDGWTTATPVADMMSEERGALLAINMNGEPLPLEHGFPARVVVPGLYGYVSATKWVVDLELIRDGEKAFYWQDRGWGKVAPIKTMSRIDVPKPFQTFPAGAVTLAGIAWAQTTGVEKVEIRLDGGQWQETDLTTEVNDQTWRMWKLEVTLAAGSHRVEVRATDRGGYTQVEERVAPIPDGATGWHSILFNVA
ncbi:molybdopterin-dependent oxidoreductase [Actinokineospora sp. 24-640]